MSYFLVRFLQTFSSITLAEDVQTKPPANWAGYTPQDKVILQHHLTMYAEVSIYSRTGLDRWLIILFRMVYG